MIRPSHVFFLVYLSIVALAVYVFPIWLLVTIHVVCLAGFLGLLARDVRKYGSDQDTWP